MKEKLCFCGIFKGIISKILNMPILLRFPQYFLFCLYSLVRRYEKQASYNFPKILRPFWDARRPPLCALGNACTGDILYLYFGNWRKLGLLRCLHAPVWGGRWRSAGKWKIADDPLWRNCYSSAWMEILKVRKLFERHFFCTFASD